MMGVTLVTLQNKTIDDGYDCSKESTDNRCLNVHSGSWGKGGWVGGSAQRLKALIVCVNVYFGRCRALLFSSAFVVFPEKCIKTEYLLFL